MSLLYDDISRCEEHEQYEACKFGLVVFPLDSTLKVRNMTNYDLKTAEYSQKYSSSWRRVQSNVS